MKRLSFLTALFGIGVAKAQKADPAMTITLRAPSTPARKKFVITGPFCSKAIEVQATDVLDAIGRAGFTVWTEERWREALQNPAIQKMEAERDAYPECGRKR